MRTKKTKALAPRRKSMLTAREFHQLAVVPPEVEWLANITNERTRRAYKKHVGEFAAFLQLKNPESFRLVTRAHVIRWRRELEHSDQSAATIRAKLSALSSLYEYLSEKNAVTHNPVKGVKRPGGGSNEGKTAAISDAQAHKLLEAPDPITLKGKRDRAIIATFLYHGLRREELCKLNVSDYQRRRDLLTFQVHGKRGKVRYVPIHPVAAQLIADYLEAAGHGPPRRGPLFRPVKNNRTDQGLNKALTPHALYKILRVYALRVGIDVENFSPHSLRATAATNALEHQADIAKVQTWLGHESISTTRLYDKRKDRPEESPTYKVEY